MIAPDFPDHLEWLNAEKRYALGDFKGKFILLDFWTYCCINCMHVLTELKKLERAHPELVVIGVHSAKFHNEKALENIKQAVLRYDIEHPVIVDNDFLIWRTYGINAWPSFVLIGPDGQIIGKTSGEDIFDRMDAVIKALGKKYEDAGLLNPEPLHFALLKTVQGESFLRFPGKIEADRENRRIFISDSNHNRIIAANPEGDVLFIIGSGNQGSSDGSFSDASFFRPQGLAYDYKRDLLYIADTENHLIRRADLKAMKVARVLGSGRKGFPPESGMGPCRDMDLNSPWDLTIMGDDLYIAMAGDHQIWAMSQDTLQARVYAGTGQEEIIDGQIEKAAMAQPSGLDSDGKRLFIADSEISAIRLIEDGLLTTLIGRGLFEFGDVDGSFAQARLQHPIGVLYHDGALYIADSYNQKIKEADLSTRMITTLIGDGSGRASRAHLREPNDIAFLDGRFYIADTNNHMIRIFDPDSRELSELSFKDLSPAKRMAADRGQIDLEERRISTKAEGIRFKLELPPGYHWNRDAQQHIEVTSSDTRAMGILPILREGDFSYLMPLKICSPGGFALKIGAVAYFCSEKGMCYSRVLEFNLPLNISEGGPGIADVIYEIVP